jgi:hypothetical protein
LRGAKILEVPNSQEDKFQTNPKDQAPNGVIRGPAWELELGTWLGFGS